MTRDHAQIEKLFDELIEALRADARADAEKLWDVFEASLLEHMDVEEREILPEFSRIDAAEAAVLTSEHAAIRKKLSALGVGLDLHATRADLVAAFRKELRSHAKREYALLYRWAQHDLPESTQERIASHLGRVIQRDSRTVW